jgi:hypothetical protein
VTATEPFEGLPEGLALDDAPPVAVDTAAVEADVEELQEEVERGPSAISVQACRACPSGSACSTSGPPS